MRIPENEIRISAVPSGGPGGQNVNKVSTAIVLRFDIRASSLPQHLKARLLGLKDSRISPEGVAVIKAQEFRSQSMNREAAVGRLNELLQKALEPRKKRRKTKPTGASREKRLGKKRIRSQVKTFRGRPAGDE